MTTSTTERLSPVNLNYSSPSYVPSKVFLEGHAQQSTVHKTSFRLQRPGFSSRHLEDDAPFTLWDTHGSGFRWPTSEEMDWIRNRYNASRVDFSPPDLMIYTNQPPKTVPYTVAALLARFVPEGSDCHCSIPRGFKPLSTNQRDDLLSYSINRYEFPLEGTRHEIISKLLKEVDIREVHFVPPLIIVEIDVSTGRTYARKSLPGKAGGLNIMYHESSEGFWKGNRQKSYERLITPSSAVSDQSNYLQQSPFQLSPGICLSSAYLNSGGLQTNQWRTTTSGIMLQNGTQRRMTAANQGFQDGQDVYHPHPLGRRIGQIMTRQLDRDIALVQLDPSIEFTNARYFEAPSAQRLTPTEELMAGDWFEVDGITTGRIDLCARIITHYRSTALPTPTQINPMGWETEVGFSSFGPGGAGVTDGVCGAPIVDRDGRVAGFFRWVDPSGLYAFASAVGPLIAAGWSVV